MGRKAVIEDSATIIFRVEHKVKEKLLKNFKEIFNYSLISVKSREELIQSKLVNI